MHLYHIILYIIIHNYLSIYSVSRIAPESPVNDIINMFLYQYLYTNNKFTVKNGSYTLMLIAYRRRVHSMLTDNPILFCTTNERLNRPDLITCAHLSAVNNSTSIN